MRLLVLAPDTPYPPHRGGRADVWRRLLALRALGHELMLVHLHEPTGPLAPQAEDLAVMERVVAARFSFPIKRSPWRTLRQLAGVCTMPWHAATRLPEPAEQGALYARIDAFRPELMWLDGPWFGPLAERIAAARGLGWAYRSHNVEHRYLRRQAAAAVSRRDRIAWRLACIGVQGLEWRLMRGARAVFDISMDDLAFWQARGLQRGHWLPPLPEAGVLPVLPEPVAGDVVFVGNLATPNNVRGVEFLTQLVWPRVLRQWPAARLAIVGSNPTAHVRACIAQCAGAELRENVAQPMAHLLGARLLVNPVMTGSGVQLKMLDMLFTDRPIVTAAQGLRGLPAALAATVAVADDVEGFARAILAGLAGELVAEQVAARAAARMPFTVEGLGQALARAGLPEGGGR